MKEHDSEEMLLRRGPSRHSPPLPVAYWLHRTPSCPRGIFLPQSVDSGHEPNPADCQSVAGPVPPASN